MVMKFAEQISVPLEESTECPACQEVVRVLATVEIDLTKSRVSHSGVDGMIPIYRTVLDTTVKSFKMDEHVCSYTPPSKR